MGRGNVRAKAGYVSGRRTDGGSDTLDIGGVTDLLRTGSIRVDAALSGAARLSEWSNTPGHRVHDRRPV